MISFLTGRVVGKGLGFCLLDVHGVGFRLAMSTGSVAALPAEGDEVTVHTYLHVREDELSLFGFESADERSLFELLITVSGIGPKVALAALSAMRPAALRDAIVREDAATIATIPGIGKKTAQRLIIELKDKLGGEAAIGSGVVAAAPALAEARDALLAMGFSSAEVGVALAGQEASSAEEIVRGALKRLGGM